MDIIKWGKTRSINTNINNIEIIKNNADFNNIYSVETDYESDTSSECTDTNNIPFIEDDMYITLNYETYV